jgi:acyl-CoA reductase-like NAD-dependent aldehyde dehydrogenase
MHSEYAEFIGRASMKALESKCERRSTHATRRWVHQLVLGDAAELPFGGVKRSGSGRELGRHAVDEFANRKLIRIA